MSSLTLVTGFEMAAHHHHRFAVEQLAGHHDLARRVEHYRPGSASCVPDAGFISRFSTSSKYGPGEVDQVDLDPLRPEAVGEAFDDPFGPLMMKKTRHESG